jgi:putative ABC transport system permease protein
MARAAAPGWRRAMAELRAVSLKHQVDLLWRNVRHGFRTIRKTGTLSLAVVVTLVVGVGMNAVVFSLFNALLFRPHVIKDPSSFVQIYATLSGQWQRELHGPPSLVTLEDYNLIRSTTRTLSEVTVARWASFALDGGESASLRGMFASCNYLSAHLARPMRLGRGLVDTDCAAPGGEPVVVLGESTWQRIFASDPTILGRTLRLNDRPVTVVGVAPDEATGGPVPGNGLSAPDAAAGAAGAGQLLPGPARTPRLALDVGPPAARTDPG